MHNWHRGNGRLWLPQVSLLKFVLRTLRREHPQLNSLQHLYCIVIYIHLLERKYNYFITPVSLRACTLAIALVIILSRPCLVLWPYLSPDSWSFTSITMHDAQASKLPAYAKSASWNQVGPSPDKNNLSSIL